MKSLPGIKEEIKWGMPCYNFEGRNICYFCITKNHVGLGFYEGKYLTDRFHLFEGEGKTLRHTKFKTNNDLRKQVITQWIREAAIIRR